METAFRSEERFTQQEFRRWLEECPESDRRHYELIRGQIVMSPPAGWRHGGVEASLIARLVNHVRERRLGRIFGPSTGYELPSGDTVGPDVSFVSEARWQTLQPLPDGFLPSAPDLVIEVLSRSTARRDRTEKKEIYAENGVEEYWIVDKDRRHVTVFHRDGTTFDSGRLIESGTVPSRVLPDLALEIAQIFEDLP